MYYTMTNKTLFYINPTIQVLIFNIEDSLFLLDYHAYCITLSTTGEYTSCPSRAMAATLNQYFFTDCSPLNV